MKHKCKHIYRKLDFIFDNEIEDVTGCLFYCQKCLEIKKISNAKFKLRK